MEKGAKMGAQYCINVTLGTIKAGQNSLPPGTYASYFMWIKNSISHNFTNTDVSLCICFPNKLSLL